MAAGDVYAVGVDVVAANGYLNLQPGPGEEIVVHNIGHSQSAQLEFFDGTNFVVIDVVVDNSSWIGMYLHCTNTKYYRVKNTAGVDNNMCADGMKTK